MTQAVKSAVSPIVAVWQANNILDKICTLCVENISTRAVKKDKCITLITSKLKEVHVDLWGPHNPPSQSESVYTVILICKYT